MQSEDLISKILLFFDKYTFFIDIKLLLKQFDGSIEEKFKKSYFKIDIGPT